MSTTPTTSTSTAPAGTADLNAAFEQAIASAKAVLEISTKGNSQLAALKSKPNA